MIGIFDSGSGGLSVAKAIRALAPRADLLYFGDVAHMPYGVKSQKELEQLTFDALRRLRSLGADHIVSACNSVSTAVIRPMLDLFGARETDIVEMVGPAVELIQGLRPQRVGIMATPATIRSGMYEQRFVEKGIVTVPIACPTLSSLIEFHGAGSCIRHEVHNAVRAAVTGQCDILLLACTHYPFVGEAIQQEISLHAPGMKTVDPAHAVAQKVIQNFNLDGCGNMSVLLSAESSFLRQRLAKDFSQCTIRILDSAPCEMSKIV